MHSCDRRLGHRIPLEVFLTQYVDDRPARALAVDLSPTGIFVKTAALGPGNAGLSGAGSRGVVDQRPIALELALPGVADTIWACGKACYRRADGLAIGTGIRFTGIARAHARLIRDFCAEARREHLVRLLDRIRAPAGRALA